MLHDRAAVRIGSSIGFSIGQRIGGLRGSISPIGSWDASTSTLAQLAALATHSRTSLATMFDSTGKLTYAPNNLLTQSGTFTDASWSKLNQSVSGNTVTATSTSIGLVYKAFTPTANVNYVLSFDVAPGTAPYIYIDAPDGASDRYAWFRTSDMTVGTVNAALTASVSSIGGGRYRIAVKFNGGVGLATSYAISASAADASNTQVIGQTYNVYNATLSAVTYETTPRPGDQVITTSSAYYGPRIDYDPNTLAVKGLLIEEARTNLALSSGDHSSASWTKLNVTATANAATSPDGTTSATKLAETAVTGAHLEFNAIAQSITSGTSYTGSTFVKAAERSIVIVAVELGGVSYGKYIDLSAGTIGSTFGSAPDSSSIQNVGNGWYRVVMTKAASSTGATGFITTYGVLTDGGSVSYLGVAGSGYYRWGSQFEVDSFATSYIPTAATSVTRAADVVQFTGAALTALQGSAWSAAVQFADVASYAGNPSIFDTSSNLQTVFMNSNKAAFFPTSLNTANGLSVLASHRIAASATRSGGRSIVSDGGTVATDATAMTSPPNTYLGSNVGVGNFLNGHVASFAIYNQRLPDATLQARSVVGASY